MFVDENRPMGRTRSALLARSSCLELGYGRFMQSDPIGYDDGLNWYNYVGSDPINKVDPTGLGEICARVGGGTTTEADGTVVVTLGPVRCFNTPSDGGGTSPGSGDGGGASPPAPPIEPDVVVTARRRHGFFYRLGTFLGLRSIACNAPPPAVGGGVDAYAGLGGSISGAGSINPRNGQISVGFDLGVGVGLGGGGRYAIGKFIGLGNPSAEATPIVGAGVNLNGTLVAGPVGGTGSYQLIGSNPGDYTAAYTGGPEVSGNVNVSAHVQLNLPPLYNLGCH